MTGHIKTSIGRKLFGGMMVMSLFIILMTGVSILCIFILKKTSEKIAYEYLELKYIQDLKHSFHQLLLPSGNYLIFGKREFIQQFNTRLSKTHDKVDETFRIMSASHNKTILNNYVENIKKLVSYHNTKVKSIPIFSGSVIFHPYHIRQIGRGGIIKTALNILPYIHI